MLEKGLGERLLIADPLEAMQTLITAHMLVQRLVGLAHRLCSDRAAGTSCNYFRVGDEPEASCSTRLAQVAAALRGHLDR
ncbi:MAG: hypothetical protein ACRDPA_16040 [Solirubrobacteraceae bacterium]